MDWVDVVIIVVKVVVVFLLLNVLLAIVVWAERKILADMQSRIGPNRAGPWGILQSIADGVKLLMKEDIRPFNADKWVYPIAPAVAAIPFVTLAGSDSEPCAVRTVTCWPSVMLRSDASSALISAKASCVSAFTPSVRETREPAS